jgi:hypothetical protein
LQEGENQRSKADDANHELCHAPLNVLKAYGRMYKAEEIEVGRLAFTPMHNEGSTSCFNDDMGLNTHQFNHVYELNPSIEA